MLVAGLYDKNVPLWKNHSMNKAEGLQIGHSLTKVRDFKIECEVVNDRDVEVPFSHRYFFYAVYWVHEVRKEPVA